MLVPFLGIPGAWRSNIIILSGLFLVLTVLAPAILKKLQPTNPRSRKKQEKAVGSESELRFNKPEPTDEV